MRWCSTAIDERLALAPLERLFSPLASSSVSGACWPEFVVALVSVSLPRRRSRTFISIQQNAARTTKTTLSKMKASPRNLSCTQPRMVPVFA